jgi:hypothetical protein
MAAPKGNRFWEVRSTHGRKPIFESPEHLWEACTEYFEWVEENPLQEGKVFNYQGVIVSASVPKMRAMTMQGLYVFLDIDRKTWDLYCGRQDFIPVTTRVADIIYQQKFTGAAADLLNPNIIARDLGLKEQSESQNNVNLTISDKDAGL